MVIGRLMMIGTRRQTNTRGGHLLLSSWKGSPSLNWDPVDNVVNFIGPGNNGMNNLSYVGIEFLAQDPNDDTFSSNTPAIFETEPKEAAELDIYFERKVALKRCLFFW